MTGLASCMAAYLPASHQSCTAVLTRDTQTSSQVRRPKNSKALDAVIQLSYLTTVYALICLLAVLIRVKDEAPSFDYAAVYALSNAKISCAQRFFVCTVFAHIMKAICLRL
jgi:hypothetical protein